MPHKIILTPKRIIFAILCVTIISDALIAELNVPSNITYFNDLLWVLLLYYLIKRRALKSMQRTGLKSNVIILGLFAFVLFLSALLNFVNPLLVLWATRNSLRFYVFYVACIYYLNINDVKDILNLFFIVQIINFAIALYQFFALGLSRDNLGGIFGHGNGMALNTFQAIVYTYYLAGYFYKKQPLYKVIIVAITSIIIAAMAEEKAYYDYFVIITIIVIILSRVSLKTALIVVGCAVIIPFSLSLLEQISGTGSINILTNRDSLIQYAENSYGLSRINPFSQIRDLFFGDNILHNLIGLGFGNCESSGFDIFNSTFYKEYGYLQYMDFTHEKRFLETGRLGFGLFLLLFIDNIRLMSVEIRRTYKNNYLAIVAFTVNVIAIVSCWFSCALIVGEAYVIYFSLSIAGIIIKEKHLERYNI